uniref:G-protein coupled receptors family 1 profile domain-containing protein n=1 Tax=Caenorhabditis japonica TaxID=281687 RepID=A0A8R1E2Q2_CAEJA
MTDWQPPPLDYVRNEGYFAITYVYVVFGTITVVLNIPLALYLLKTTSRNQKELIVIIALSLSDTICAGQFLAMGIYRFCVWFDQVIFISQAACNRNVIVASYIICIQMDNCFSLVIALDRLFAVLLPFRYNKCGPGYTVLLITSPIFAALLGYAIHLVVVTILPPVFTDSICFNILKTPNRVDTFDCDCGSVQLNDYLVGDGSKEDGIKGNGTTTMPHSPMIPKPMVDEDEEIYCNKF